MKRTGPTNPTVKELILSLRKESSVSKVALWDRVADDLEKPTRERRAVNLSRIARSTKPNEMVVVFGKVFVSGSLPHSVVIAALSFSAGAKEQIESAKGKVLTIEQLLKSKPKVQDLRVLG